MQPGQRTLTEALAEDHRLIQRGLVVLARMAEQVRGGGDVHPEVVEACLRFLREFADHEHHQREEQELFPWLERNGHSHQTGPLAVLREEHERVRDQVRHLAAHARHLETDPEAQKSFVACASDLARFFRNHILKENEVLFPIAERTGAGTAELLQGQDGHAAARFGQYRLLLEQLEKAALEWPLEAQEARRQSKFLGS